ncbi:hypothetical protein [Deinococcus misasensis]|uniref:hypothetical protein n=1 Tax=Deinococcus misasensis TaxID=392413 RepID=UPI00054E00C5|nr:hypothetical protein [Deinococcus misasensis]
MSSSRATHPELWTHYLSALNQQLGTIRPYIENHPYTSSWSEHIKEQSLAHLHAIEQGYHQQEYPLVHLAALSDLSHLMNQSAGTVVRASLEALGHWVQDASQK